MTGLQWIELVTAVLLVVVVIALLTFAKVLHDLVDRLARKVDDDAKQARELQASVDRLEAVAAVVAADLAVRHVGDRSRHRQQERMADTIDRMEADSHVVADNLADSVERADATNGSPGEAADAALRSMKDTPL